MASVSVILPVRNASATLADAIESIISQTFEDWELLVIDDSSGDKSRSIAMEYSRKDQRIKVISANGNGIVDALNTGLKESGSGIIARMDADDLSHPTRLEKQYDLLEEKNEIGLVSCLVSYSRFHEMDGRGMSAYVNWVNGLCSEGDIFLQRFAESPLPHPTVMFRAELIHRFGAYRKGDFPEDYELWLRWLERGVRMEKVKEVLFTWTDHSERLSRTDQRYSNEAFWKMKSHYLSNWLREKVNMPIWIWGAGRVSRRRASHLEQGSVKIEGFIDLFSDKTNSYPCISFREIPPPGRIFIVNFVSSRGATDNIRDYLRKAEYVEGKDFLMASR